VSGAYDLPAFDSEDLSVMRTLGCEPFEVLPTL